MMMGEVLPSRGLSNHAVDAAGTKGVGGIEEVREKGCFLVKIHCFILMMFNSDLSIHNTKVAITQHQQGMSWGTCMNYILAFCSLERGLKWPKKAQNLN